MLEEANRKSTKRSIYRLVGARARVLPYHGAMECVGAYRTTVQQYRILLTAQSFMLMLFFGTRHSSCERTAPAWLMIHVCGVFRFDRTAYFAISASLLKTSWRVIPKNARLWFHCSSVRTAVSSCRHPHSGTRNCENEPRNFKIPPKTYASYTDIILAAAGLRFGRMVCPAAT